MMSDPLGEETNASGAEQPLGPVDGMAPPGAAATEEAAPADVLSDERFHFDGRAFGQPPVRGDVTREEELASYDGTTVDYAVNLWSRRF